jgi:ferric enterobactin receptor
MKPAFNNIKQSLLVVVMSTAILTLHTMAYAQAVKPVQKIFGMAADSLTKAPLDYLTVTLLSATDSIIKADVTKRDGSFSFANLKPAPYRIRIQGIGFLTKTINADGTGNMGTIYLSANKKLLKSVNVTASKPLIKQEADRIIYDLEADPQSKVSSVLDMMRKVPYLSVDGDENVLLKGSTGYRIFINGKPSGMIERNPKDILRSMPASTIKSIEVITNPSSRYDAEGLAGIINIVTIKQVDNGYHGSINLNGKAPVGGPGAGATFTYKQGRFGLSALAGGSIYNTPQTSGFNSRATSGSKPTLLEQNSNRESDKKTGYTGVDMSYEIDSLNLISAQFNLNGNTSSGIAGQISKLTAPGTTLQQYSLLNNNHNEGNGADAALNYQLGFKANKNQALTFSYRYMSNAGNLFNDIDVANAINYANPDYRQLNDEGVTEHTAQIDYTQPFKRFSMEAGVKGIFRSNNSDFQYRNLNAVTNLYDLDGNRSNTFNNQQDVYAAYNSYNYSTGKWQIKAGVRVEQTSISGDYNQGSMHIRQNYLNVAPSAVINRKLDKVSSLSLSYSRRIQRPAIAQLNPFVDRSNPDFESSGNPELRPATANVLQLSYLTSKKATLNIAFGYMNFNGAIVKTSAYDPARRITVSSFDNAGRGIIYKANIYVNMPITKAWNMSLNSDVRHVDFYATIKNTVVKNSRFMAYVIVSGGYSFNKGWRLNADFTGNTGGVSGVQGKINGFTASTFSVNKVVIKNKLTLSATVSNPFSKYRYINETTIGPDFTQVSNNQSYYRSFGASLNYQFGKLKTEIKKNKRGINNDDLSN